MSHINITPRQAFLLAESFELFSFFRYKEEVDLLQEHNPELLEAMRALVALAKPGPKEAA